ncbi:unnamed protein product [Citrullus colocynthis]|uniref:Uncharacterized protein n=1 Tax=Citrullus colocynthis TaxID=252529 RepID=A0ABP0YUZ2_9ROSI
MYATHLGLFGPNKVEHWAEVGFLKSSLSPPLNISIFSIFQRRRLPYKPPFQDLHLIPPYSINPYDFPSPLTLPLPLAAPRVVDNKLVEGRWEVGLESFIWSGHSFRFSLRCRVPIGKFHSERRLFILSSPSSSSWCAASFLCMGFIPPRAQIRFIGCV